MPNLNDIIINDGTSWSSISSEDYAAIINPFVSGGGGSDEVLEYINLASFPITGVISTIYIDKTTNYLYRWSCSAYVP